MAQEEYRPPIKEFLDMLADLLAEKYFERVEDRMEDPRTPAIDYCQRGEPVLKPLDGHSLPNGLPEKTPLPQNRGPGSFRCESPRPLD